MNPIITYSLKPDAVDSNEYYRTISAFADEWLAQSLPEVQDLVAGFREYHLSRSGVDLSEAEYTFELLALGVLLREHGREARRMPGWLERWMPRLIALQAQSPHTEKAFKALRGWLGWIAGHSSDGGDSQDDVWRLIRWFRANDETTREKRFEPWHEYFLIGGELFLQEAVSKCLTLADAFASASRERLRKYTANVEHFLSTEAPRHRHRYDAGFVARTQIEYHLGMLGTEILNQAYRQRFLATRQKMVILPPCMCAPAEKCQAVETPLGAKCQACTPGCRVNQITKLGEKRGFQVTIMPDDVKVFRSGKGTQSIGLVGVSCALTNWNGGWETGELGIPAQGLLLDYVGCKIHWDKEGIPTDTNFKKLQEILGV
jgi:hypothetical protein